MMEKDFSIQKTRQNLIFVGIERYEDSPTRNMEFY